jgi:SpoVK/Ycf46/Vps4 family AAA+-type ATPase
MSSAAIATSNTFEALIARLPALGFLMTRLERYSKARTSGGSLLDPTPLHDALIPSHVQDLAERFELTAFQRDTLLLALLAVSNSSAAQSFADLNGESSQRFPSALTALELLSDGSPEDWEGVRRLQTLGLLRVRGDGLHAVLILVDRVAAHLRHEGELPDTLELQSDPLLQRAALESQVTVLTEAQKGLLEDLREAWGETLEPLALFGGDAESRRAVAARLCTEAGFTQLHTVPITSDAFVPNLQLARLTRDESASDSVQAWGTALNREARLSRTAFLLEIEDDVEAVQRGLSGVLSHLDGAVTLISSRDALQLRFGLSKPRLVQNFQMPPLESSERFELWAQALTNGAPEISESSWHDLLKRVLREVNKRMMRPNAPMIARASAQALQRFKNRYGHYADLEDNAAQQDQLAVFLMETTRTEIRKVLDAVPSLNRVSTKVKRETLVLCEEAAEVYDDIIEEAQNALEIEEDGFYADERGRGITALFSGPSGTGKTTAAAALANQLDMDLYVIDLSQTQSKYIGETNKNLKLVFEAAQFGGVVLVFDEADSLFGKRTAVKDSHDRFANQDVNFLLQGLENFDGVAILTTNLESSIDDAFQRRLRHIARFKLPTIKERQQIWQRLIPVRHHPEHTEGSDLNLEHLAQIEVTGANIKNIINREGSRAVRRGRLMDMRGLYFAARKEVKRRGSWNYNWMRDWAILKDFMDEIPPVSIGASAYVEIFDALTVMLTDAGISTVTCEEMTEEWYSGLVESVVNLECFQSQDDKKLTIATPDGKGRMEYMDHLIHVFPACKEARERNQMRGLMLSMFKANAKIPSHLIPSAGGAAVNLRMGDAAEKSALHQHTTQNRVPAGMVIVVSLPMRTAFKIT